MRERFSNAAERKHEAEVLRARYNAGATIRELATEFVYSYGLVHKLLQEAGTLMRPRWIRATQTWVDGERQTVTY